MHLKGGLSPGQENCVGQVVAHGGAAAAEQAASAIRTSSSTQMLREHTQGSRIQRKFQSAGQALGRGPQSGALFIGGHTVPGQIEDSFRGKRQRVGAIEAPSGPVTLIEQLLHPSGAQEEIFTPLH